MDDVLLPCQRAKTAMQGGICRRYFGKCNRQSQPRIKYKAGGSINRQPCPVYFSGPSRTVSCCAPTCLVLTKKMLSFPPSARKGMFAGETLAGFPLLFNNPRRRRAICETNRRGTNQKRTSKWMSSFDWCRWWDSNPHGVATNGF